MGGFVLLFVTRKKLFHFHVSIYFFIRLAAAQVELDAVMATLKEKQDSLAAVEEKVSFGILVIYFDGLNSKCGYP